MGVTSEQVLHVAYLARLHLSEEEVSKFTAQLNEILEYVAQINELDVSQIEPTSHVIPIINEFCEDGEPDIFELEKALQNAPKRYLNYVQVPRVVDE